jgi:hypothetical protein
MEDLIKETIEEAAYLDLERDFNEILMGTPRDSFGKFMQSSVIVEGVRVGWYQDSKGSLYHYDGVIWDVVPDGNISRLEYLG